MALGFVTKCEQMYSKVHDIEWQDALQAAAKRNAVCTVMILPIVLMMVVMMMMRKELSIVMMTIACRCRGTPLDT